ncbi:MAG: replication initiator, partial [Nocardioides sp.]
MTDLAAPTDSLLGSAGVESAERRARGCSRPVRLRGAKELVDTTTGEVRTLYSSADELDGQTYVRCGNRRASVCPTCSHEYKGDAWHLLMCGLAGGKGVPETVRDRPCTFVTMTAPSFGAVHGLRDKGLCRARRDRPVCEHGRPLWCTKRHHESDTQLGQPLCWECYDYTGHVLWQWHAPELWRRFTIALQRDLAKRAGLSVSDFRGHCRIAYSKVVEFQ